MSKNSSGLFDEADPPSQNAKTENESSPPSADGAENVGSEGRRSRRRSNRPFPPATFEEAVKFARGIYEFNSGLPVRKLTFFNHLGRSPESSSSRDAITNANKYGLVKGSFKSEQLELTPDALMVVGDDVPYRNVVLSKVRLGIEGIEPFRLLCERISGIRLPSKSALVDSIKDLGVSEDFAEEAIDIFIVNLRYVGLLQVLSGAERVVPIDHLLEAVPAGSTASQPSVQVYSVTAETIPEPRPSLASDAASFDTTCFYVTPIGSAGSETRKHSDLFLSSIVEPAMETLGLRVVRADNIGQSGIITRQIMDFIFKSKLVVADLSFHNPNVFYELALRHAVRLPIVQIIRQRDSIPFDVSQMRTIPIDDGDLYSFVPNIEVYRSEVAAQARRALDAGVETDNPVSTYFPTLKASVA